MNLTHLSFQRAPRLSKVMPAAPAIADRLRMLRIELAKRAEVGNDYRWNFNGSQPGGDPLAVPRIPAGCLPQSAGSIPDGWPTAW